MKLPLSTSVTLIKKFGGPDESRQTVECSVQGKKGYFSATTPVYEGDVIEVPDPRGGLRHLHVGTVVVNAVGSSIDHIEAIWGEAPKVREAPIRRIGPENLHPDILRAASDLFADGHYVEAIFNAFKAVELRVKAMSGLDQTGEPLMAAAFGDRPRIRVSVEQGTSGESEQRGFKFLFMGAMAGIRNPKAHEFVQQRDPQRALEYLAFASILMRRLDDATVVPGAAP